MGDEKIDTHYGWNDSGEVLKLTSLSSGTV